MGRRCQKSNDKASSGHIRNNNRTRVKQKDQQKVANGNTISIHDNPSTEDDIILMRLLSEGKVLTRQIQNNEVQVRDVQQGKW